MTEGNPTNSHVDITCLWWSTAKIVFARCPAGTMMYVNRELTGPAKRAIVMCAHDKDRVIEILG